MSSIIYPDYQHLWNTTVILHPEEVETVAARILSHRARYQSIYEEVMTPWEVVGILHYRECDCDFTCHLANGDSLERRTYHVPKGLPLTGVPPFTWEEGAIAALNYDDMFREDWHSLPGILQAIEAYNGTGYIRYHPECLSPYLWAGTNHYTAGKYTGDGTFNPRAVDKQVGAVPLYKYLTDKTLGLIH